MEKETLIKVGQRILDDVIFLDSVVDIVNKNAHSYGYRLCHKCYTTNRKITIITDLYWLVCGECRSSDTF